MGIASRLKLQKVDEIRAKRSFSMTSCSASIRSARSYYPVAYLSEFQDVPPGCTHFAFRKGAKSAERIWSHTEIVVNNVPITFPHRF
jgi:hypothetical protein